MSGTLYGVGLGPGDPDLITLKAARLIGAARVLAWPALEDGDSFARSIAAGLIAPGTREIAIRVPMRDARGPAQAAYDRAAAEIAAALEAGEDVACLCEGDPLFYGSFMYLFARLSPRFRVEVVPGVTSLTAAAARAGRPLAARNEVISVLPAPLADAELTARIAAADTVAVLKLGPPCRTGAGAGGAAGAAGPIGLCRAGDPAGRAGAAAGRGAGCGAVFLAGADLQGGRSVAVDPVIVVALQAQARPLAHRVAEAHRRRGARPARACRPSRSMPSTIPPAHLRELFAAGVPRGRHLRRRHPDPGAGAADLRTSGPSRRCWRWPRTAAAVVPLLGGHRGANALAARIGAALGVAPALTTAGEVSAGLALDAPPRAGCWTTPRTPSRRWRRCCRAAARGSTARRPKAGWHRCRRAMRSRSCARPRPPRRRRGRLVYRPQRAALGVGCSRDCPPDELIALVDGLLAEAGLAPAALRGGLHARPEGRRAGDAGAGAAPSPAAAAVLAAGAGGRDAAAGQPLGRGLCRGRLPWRRRSGGAGGRRGRRRRCTGAEASRPRRPPRRWRWRREPILPLRGRARGRLSVVGIGPGQADWRTPEASRLIAEAEELVGYGLYLDLLGPLAAGKPRADFPLGGEEARCRYALERAGEGRNVALVCSGDAGIYAMAALVYELLDRPEGPAVSAVRRGRSRCSLRARDLGAAGGGGAGRRAAGARFLRHLAVRPADPARGHPAPAAGGGGGRLRRRLLQPGLGRGGRSLLAEARDILLTGAPGATPVLLATNLGPARGERCAIRRLEDAGGGRGRHADRGAGRLVGRAGWCETGRRAAASTPRAAMPSASTPRSAGRDERAGPNRRARHRRARRRRGRAASGGDICKAGMQAPAPDFILPEILHGGAGV